MLDAFYTMRRREIGEGLMPNYVVAYQDGRKPETLEETAEFIVRCESWVAKLGEKVVTPPTRLRNSKVIQSDGEVTEPGRERLTGFSVITAESMEDALEIAKQCPHLEIGTVEVAEVIGTE